jgi:hypothetical protein
MAGKNRLPKIIGGNSMKLSRVNIRIKLGLGRF